jgi:hypothetical protein
MRPEFLKLVAEVAREAAKPPASLAEGVDNFLSVLRTDASPILPRVEVLNEAGRVYLDSGMPNRAINLIANMQSSCT